MKKDGLRIVGRDWHRRQFISLAVAGVSLPTSFHVNSQMRFPAKPVRVIVGFPPGGAIDVVFRVIAKNAQAELGQAIVVENRPGAGGTLGIMQMKNSVPDGYTLGVTTMGVFKAPVIENVGYDPIADVTYIVGLTDTPFGIVVRADTPFHEWAGLREHGKRHPAEMDYGVTGGLGSSAHLLLEEMTRQDGVRWNPIPYKGGPDNQQGLMAGDVRFAVDGSASFVTYVDAGRTRLLAIASPERSPKWPTVPTITELGYRAAVDSVWGLGGPRGLDPKVIEIIHNAFAQALNSPQVKTTLARVGQVSRLMNHEEYTRFAVRTAAEQKALLEKFGFGKKR